MKTIQVRRTRHAGHCWRSRDELISDVFLWTPAYGQAKAGRPALTYIQQLCEDTGCRPEDLQEAMNDMKKWRERVRDIRATGTTWWYIILSLLMYVHRYIDKFTCAYACIGAYICIQACIGNTIHLNVCAYEHKHICICLYLRAPMHLHTVYVCICAFMYLLMCIDAFSNVCMYRCISCVCVCVCVCVFC